MLRNSAERYGGAAVLLHWLTAILFAVQIGLGFLMTTGGDEALVFSLFQWHKSFGFLLLALMAIRLPLALIDRHPADPPVPQLVNVLADAGHRLLYVGLLVVPLSGWLVASTSPLDIPSYVFDIVVVPPLPLARSDAAEALWTDVHGLAAWATAVLVVFHVAAAFWHHFWRRDGLLRRMWF